MCRDMMIQENLTISGAVREGAKRLKQCGIENADYDSYALLSEINGMDRTYYLIEWIKAAYPCRTGTIFLTILNVEAVMSRCSTF